MKYNVYLIEATEDADIGYDCYDSFVIIASSPIEARNYCMSGDEGQDTWLNKKLSTVKKIGESNKPKGCYCASFNQG